MICLNFVLLLSFVFSLFFNYSFFQFSVYFIISFSFFLIEYFAICKISLVFALECSVFSLISSLIYILQGFLWVTSYLGFSELLKFVNSLLWHSLEISATMFKYLFLHHTQIFFWCYNNINIKLLLLPYSSLWLMFTFTLNLYSQVG